MKNKELRNMIIISIAVTVMAAILAMIFLSVGAGLAVFITGALLSVLFIIYTVNRYKKIEKLNDYLVRVLAENDTDEILDQEEGELSILKTNIYKTTSTLKYQKELLKKMNYSIMRIYLNGIKLMENNIIKIKMIME